MTTISGKTSLVALLGQPTNHSLSPIIQNAAIQEMKLDWSYMALSCSQENLETVLKGLSAINCKGLNITIPHKEHVVQFCSSLSPLAKRLRAVNTLLPDGQGGWKGFNTDVEGFINPLISMSLKKKQALVIGNGGSAKAVIEGLKRLGFAKVTIVGRSQDKINDFLNEHKIANEGLKPTIEIEGITDKNSLLTNKIQQSELIVNTSPIGMKRKEIETKNQFPLGKSIWNNLDSSKILYDLIYIPKPTAWLDLGSKKSCKTIDGLEMLIHQGAASLKLWSNCKRMPIKAMRISAENYLSD